MGENDLGGEASKYERQSEAEENEVVLLHQGAIRRKDPGADGEGEASHGNHLGKNRENGETSALTSLNDIVYAKGDLGEDKRANDEGDPDVSESDVPQESGNAW